MKTSRIVRLSAIRKNTENIIRFANMRQEDDGGGMSGLAKTGLGLAGAGAVGGAGYAYYRNRGAVNAAVSNLAGAQVDRAKEAFTQARTKVAPAEEAVRSGVQKVGNFIAPVVDKTKELYGRSTDYAGKVASAAGRGFERAEGFIPRVKRAITSGAKAAVHTRFSSLDERLITLRSIVGETINFEEAQDNAYVPRYLLGTPLYSAISARKGQKLKAYGHQVGHSLKEIGKGLGIGAAAGAGIGAAVGVASRGKIHIGQAARAGSASGAYLGSVIGGLNGNFGARSTEIMRRYQ